VAELEARAAGQVSTDQLLAVVEAGPDTGPAGAGRAGR